MKEKTSDEDTTHSVAVEHLKTPKLVQRGYADVSGRSFSYFATTFRGSDESQRYVTNDNPKLEANKTVLVRFAAVHNTVSRNASGWQGNAMTRRVSR